MTPCFARDLAIPKSLAKQGVKVVLTGRNEVNLKQVADQVSELSQTDVVTEILDVTSQEAVESTKLLFYL